MRRHGHHIAVVNVWLWMIHLLSGDTLFALAGEGQWRRPVSMEYLLQVFPKCGMSELLLHITIDTKLRLGYFTLIGYTYSLFHRFNISEHMVFEV